MQRGLCGRAGSIVISRRLLTTTMHPHKCSFSQYPLAQLATAFSAGICVANYLPPKLTVALIGCAVCSILSLVLLVLKRVPVAGLVLLPAFLFSGATLASLENRPEHARDIKRVVENDVADGSL